MSEAGFDPRDELLTCAWHGGCFDIRTGAAVIPPATEPVETFPIRTSPDGWVEIALTGSLAHRRLMSIEALPFVNWIFWTALSAGTLLVVGVTELGWHGKRLLHGLAGGCWRSPPCCSLRAHPVRGHGRGCFHLRADAARLVLAFAAVTAAYLDQRRWRGRHAGLAIAGGLVGVLALAMAAGSPTLSPLLFSVQLALAALALGAVNAAMLLGHWYLVTPKLSPARCAG